MKFYYYILFWLLPVFGFSQYEIKEIVKNQCVQTIPTSFTIFENPTYTPSYRSIKNEFVALFSDYDERYWTIANYVYPTALDAYNNTNPYERDVVGRLVEFEISNPAIFYLRLDENLLENPRKVIIKYQVNFAIQPPIRYGFEVIGCELDNETNVYNLNKALFDIYSYNYYYNFTFYKNFQDASLNQNPIPEFELENYRASKTDESIYLKVGYNSDYIISDCVSIFSLKLSTINFDNYIPNKDLTFCGVPYKIEGPFDRNNVFQFNNFEWYHNGNLVSDEFKVNINDVGQWEVFFDVSTGCRSSITINVTQETGENYIKNVRSTMSQVIIEAVDSNLISGYSTDGEIWQDSNIFNNSTDLFFTFYFKNNQGCVFGPFTYDISNFFTFLSPNSDGINDKWDIRSKLKLEENNYSIQIFDRQGKILIEGLLKDILPWNGYYNNRKLATGSYWYRIFKDKVEVKSGSILLKN
ncbi:MAG: T9SS type B sorting domain-containing protein [Weeksellaceae bacterium]|nr:T9SS type B sorting domain-containing protein [Weeksellaceae bacterium]